ncbi:hypothetical protein HDV05_006120, partial [Chytridiales sp. JEL 0842]
MAIGFDGCQQEVWSTLSTGATLILREEDVFETLKKVDAVFMTPTGLSQIGGPSQYPNIRTITVGGEVCPNNLKDVWAAHVSFNNFYGPTEVSIMSHAACLKLGDTPTVGMPVPNTISAILDVNQKMIPIGVVGELYVGGIGVFTSYVNLPEMNVERYVDIDVDGEIVRMFRTGDLCRLLPDGRFDVLGRKDDQVKLKGYRIELEEVANALRKFPAVTSAAAIVKDKTLLIGFVSPASLDKARLLEFVADLLPAFMIPAAVMGLDIMPMTSNGKINRKALESIEVVREVTELETDVETTLATAIAEVLGISPASIGRTSSFIALGGDSISAIRLVTTARRLGLGLTTAQILRAPSLSSLASRCTKCSGSKYSMGSVVGQVPLTPIQHVFFNHPWKNLHHFNQSFVLIPRTKIDVDDLRAAIAKLLRHHDMLRCRFYQDSSDVWIQEIMPPTETEDVNVTAALTVDDSMFEEIVAIKQRSLSITKGPLYSVHLADFDNGSQKLFFTIHHLVIDLVSWRIVLDDLERLLLGGRLETKTMSFKDWSQSLSKKATDFNPNAWDKYLSTSEKGMELPEAETAYKVEVGLAKDMASQLDKASALYNTNVQELVLAGLALAWIDWSSHGSCTKGELVFDLEGHGREPWDDDVDISGTVGWFTTIYPIKLPMERNASVQDLLLDIKEKLRSIPDRGLSYGAIKYLAEENSDNASIKSHSLAPILFNYFGRFQQLNGKGFFVNDNSVKANSMVLGPHERLFHLGDMSCGHHDDQLFLSLKSLPTIINEEEARGWLSLWPLCMERIIQHCIDPLAPGRLTPSDLHLLKNPTVISDIETELRLSVGVMARDVEDVYPVTPLQFGMWSATFQNKSEYTVQLVLDVRGDLDVTRLRNAWKRCVLKSDLTEWNEMDEVWDVDELSLTQKTEALLRHDRLRGYSVSDQCFNRFIIVPLSDGRIRILWSQHHSVIDGWSMPIVMGDFVHAAAGNIVVAPEQLFRNHVESVLAKSSVECKAFWTQFTEAVSHSSKLNLRRSLERDAKSTNIETTYGLLQSVIDAPTLTTTAKNLGVTTSSLVRLAWAITLKHYTRENNVVFGSVVSGRESAVNGMESLPFSVDVVKAEEFADFPVSMVLGQTEASLSIKLTYKEDMVDMTLAAKLVDKFIAVLLTLLETSCAGQLELYDHLTADDLSSVRQFSYGLQISLPYSCVHQGFELQVIENPTLTAVEQYDRKISYYDLDIVAQSLASELAELGACVGKRVAIVMQRCIEFPLSLLAVLKTGATLVPIDIKFPAERIRYMLEDSACTMVVSTLSESEHVTALGLHIPVVFADSSRASRRFRPTAVHSATRDSEYLIVYTSGSTGKPKGVLIPHKGAVNIISNCAAQLGCAKGKRMLQFMAIGFDGCQFEIWSALSTGATLVLREEDVFKTLKKVDAVFITPTGLSQIGSPAEYANLKTITVGGEACPTSLKDKWAAHVTFNNIYGPTEITIISHGTRILPQHTITIGRPLPNTISAILDGNQRMVPIGVVGELYVGGIGVSTSYINLPEMNIERFFEIDFDGERIRMFKTGDLCRLLPDGRFDILGRKDDQVKLRGYRVELDEISAALQNHPMVTTAAAIIKDKTNLIAYVTPADAPISELLDFALASLPFYMVPHKIVGLDVMPTNVNGKTDKLKLQELDVAIEIDEISSDTEQQVAMVWSEVLNVPMDKIGSSTSFFELGGDSISAVKVVSRSRQYGFDISVKDLFKLQTVSRCADLVQSSKDRVAVSYPDVFVSDSVKEEIQAEWAPKLGLMDGWVAYPCTPLQT